MRLDLLETAVELLKAAASSGSSSIFSCWSVVIFWFLKVICYFTQSPKGFFTTVNATLARYSFGSRGISIISGRYFPISGCPWRNWDISFKPKPSYCGMEMCLTSVFLIRLLEPLMRSYKVKRVNVDACFDLP
jgi:hypothetical protein